MSGFARWGWLGVAINAVFVLANIVCVTLLDGGAINWMAIVICTASGFYSFTTWRSAVDLERRWQS